MAGLGNTLICVRTATFGRFRPVRFPARNRTGRCLCCSMRIAQANGDQGWEADGPLTAPVDRFQTYFPPGTYTESEGETWLKSQLKMSAADLAKARIASQVGSVRTASSVQK